MSTTSYRLHHPQADAYEHVGRDLQTRETVECLDRQGGLPSSPCIGAGRARPVAGSPRALGQIRHPKTGELKRQNQEVTECEEELAQRRNANMTRIAVQWGDSPFCP